MGKPNANSPICLMIDNREIDLILYTYSTE